MKHSAKLYDMCAFIVAFVFATFVLRSSPTGMSLSEFMAVRIKLGNCLLSALFLVALHNLFVLCGLYVSKRLTSRSAEIYGIYKATLLASAFLFLTAKALHMQMISIPFVLILWIVCTWAMVSGRLAARSLLLTLRRRGHNRRFLLIVGTNERAIEFAEWIRMRLELGYHIVGFVDDDWVGLQKFDATGHTRCCSFSGLADFLRHNVVDEAAIYLPLRSYYEHAAQLVSLCEQHGIVIRADSQIFKLRKQNSSALELDENSQVVAVIRSTKAWPALIKRFIDCFVSVIALILLAPLFLVVSLLVKFTSEGPVLFRQTRVGLNKRMFSIYKFRSMVTDAEKVQDQLLSMNDMTGPVFKIKDDPRVTALGRILRKTSIDELPQLFNVLKGEMSLVGPRAMSLRDYKLFDQDWHRRRFSVKPGITCLWQVHGRSSIPFEKWMELDLQYIDKWSLWLDLKILAQTVPAVLRGTGAA
ncbi:MAG TPA: sugar transferase [Candidatus Dormibacteraeota bacterium]|nr:sugar transferase [Candidatus Dormibacteraeota bacterium]